MRGGFRIFRIFGINIYMDPSWIFIFLLVTWNLAGVVFPNLHPGWSTGTNLGIGLLASLLFFTSVLAHELSHSLMARAKGLPVGRITLFIFGGAADIGREPPSAGSEFLIAVIGPITSLVLGGLFLAFGALSIGGLGPGTALPGGLESLSPAATLFFWLGPINVLLALFNMVPGFPLDGGRVFRSILWKIFGSLRLATRWATITGQFIAWGFIVTGAAMVFGIEVPILGSGIFSGLWLAFIGWFLNNAAIQSYRQVVVDEMLDGVTVERLMVPHVPVVDPDDRLESLVETNLVDRHNPAAVVARAGRLLGIVQMEDARKLPKKSWANARVREVMSPLNDLLLLDPLDAASEALNKLNRTGIYYLPVVDGGNLVGVLRRRDISRWLEIHSDLV